MRWSFASVLVLASIAFFAPEKSSAQLPQLNELESEYANAFARVLDEWESGNLTFQRTDTFEKTFAERADGFALRQATSYAESQLSVESVYASWALLPEELTAEYPLSSGAKLVLIGGVVDAAATLSESGIEADYNSLVDALSFSLYITLAAAQQETIEEGDDQIDAVAVRRGGIWFFSLGWPFCCAETVPEDAR